MDDKEGWLGQITVTGERQHTLPQQASGFAVLINLRHDFAAGRDVVELPVPGLLCSPHVKEAASQMVLHARQKHATLSSETACNGHERLLGTTARKGDQYFDALLGGWS